VTKKYKRPLPAVYLDEHIPPTVATVFRPTFRTFEAARSPRLKGRDEMSYLGELYSDNGIFVTSDLEFVKRVLEAHTRHAGIVWIPKQLLPEEKVQFAQIVAGYVQGACSGSRTVFRNRVFFPGHDGLRTTGSSDDRGDLEFSWDSFFQMFDNQQE